MQSLDGRFEIVEERTDSHDHFMSADYEHRVVEVATGKVLATFHERFHGTCEGARTLRFSADGRSVIVTNHDDTEQTFELPA